MQRARTIRPPRRFKMRPIRAADLFCGSGGFSTALVLACQKVYPGRALDMVAVNHWQVAIDTHQKNHPGVRHMCADLMQVKPREAVPGGVLDLLLAAPSCTYHSRARGGKPVYDQQRMDPWVVHQWCTELRVHALLVENVPEFVDWGPCDARTGKPIKSRKGEYFRAWIAAIKALGFRLEWKVANCADYGDATTRERFFLYGRSDKKPLRWAETDHAPRGKETDLFGTRKTWRSAAEIIDWSRLGTSIFTRKRPLVKNTIKRLLAGAKRNHWPQQHVDALQALLDGKKPRLYVTAEEAEVIARQLGVPLVMATGGGGTARGVDRPIPGITTGGHNGATPHFAEPVVMATGSNGAARGVTNPVPTITTGGATNAGRPGNARPHFAEPILLHKSRSEGGRQGRPTSEPAGTLTTEGAPTLARPILTPYYGGGSGLSGQSVDQPMPAQGTHDRFAVATPALIRAGHGDDRHTADGRVLDNAEPVPAITGSNEVGIAQPTIFRVNQGHGRTRGISSGADPVPTLTATESLGVATPFMVAHFGERPGQEPRTRQIMEPTPTIGCSNTIALAQPFVSLCTHGNEGNASRPVADPIGTVTTAKGGEMTLATPAMAEGYYIDILYRMLHWTELARATSFEDQGRKYHFTGNSTQITKQIGNAVPIRTGTALCCEALAA